MDDLIKMASLELQASILADMWEEELVKEATPPDAIPPEQMSRPPLGESPGGLVPYRECPLEGGRRWDMYQYQNPSYANERSRVNLFKDRFSAIPPIGSDRAYTDPFMQRAFADRLRSYTDAPGTEAPVGTQTAEEEAQRQMGESLARTPAYASMAAQQLRNRSGALLARASERIGDFAGDPKYHEELNRYLQHGRDVSELEAALREDAPGVAPEDQIPPLEEEYIQEPSNYIYDAAEDAKAGVDA